MLQIMLGPDKLSPNDPLGRSRVGYRPGMSEPEVWEAARGCWVFNADRALAEDEAQVISADQIVRAVVRVNGIVKTREPTRFAIEGKLLVGDPRVGRPTAMPHPSRNPIAYV